MLPILISIGPLQISSLSFFLVLAWCVWSLVFWKALSREATPEERIFDLMFWATLAALAVSRAGFVLLHPELFTGSLLQVVALWVVPGLSLYPGLLAAVATLVILAKRSGVRVALVADALAAALPGALAIGAVGALLGGSVVGVATNLPWAVPVVGESGLRHPVGAYMAVGLLVLLVSLAWLEVRAKLRDWPWGLLGVWFFLLFSALMFGLEFLVAGSVYWAGLRANQWMLIFIFSQAVGAFYVRGGGREVMRRFYDRIRPRSA